MPWLGDRPQLYPSARVGNIMLGVMRMNQEWRSNHDDIQIGNDVIVGAQSVVIKDVSPYAVVGGTPGWFIT